MGRFVSKVFLVYCGSFFFISISISIYFVQNQVGLHSQKTNEQDSQAQHALTAARCNGP